MNNKKATNSARTNPEEPGRPGRPGVPAEPGCPGRPLSPGLPLMPGLPLSPFGPGAPCHLGWKREIEQSKKRLIKYKQVRNAEDQAR